MSNYNNYIICVYIQNNKPITTITSDAHIKYSIGALRHFGSLKENDCHC